MDREQGKIVEDYLNKPKGDGCEKAFFELFQRKGDEAGLKRKMRADWDGISPKAYSSENLKPILHKIHFLINSEKQPKNSNAAIKLVLNWYSRIAAVLLLPMLLLGVLYGLFKNAPQGEKYSQVEVIAPLGSRIHTQLPDGTSGWLNSGSVLSYSIPFDERSVKIKGEAYFDVQTDSLRPFTVKGKHGAVRVLGTSFNVKMWPDEELTEVVLVKGKVQLIPNQSEKIFEMLPREMLVYNSKKRKLQRKNVNPEHYTAWIDGKLMLRGENMEELARELARWFNVDVEVEDNSLSDYTFRATFENERLEDVLRLLKMISPVEYEIIDNQQNGKGDFSKKKVIIRHNKNWKPN